jgi:hypothetical protein
VEVSEIDGGKVCKPMEEAREERGCWITYGER